MSIKVRIIFVLFLVLTLFSSSAFAISRKNKKRAKVIFKQGQEFYKKEDFANAKDKFVKAHEIYPIKAFLYNIGQCYFQLDDYENAAKYYEEFLKDNDAAPNYGIVENYLLEAKSRLNAQKAKVEAARAKLAAEESSKLRKKADEAALKAEEEKVIAEQNRKISEAKRLALEKEIKEREDSIAGQWWFWTGIAVGTTTVVAATAGGTWIYFDMMASQSSLGVIDTQK